MCGFLLLFVCWFFFPLNFRPHFVPFCAYICMVYLNKILSCTPIIVLGTWEGQSMELVFVWLITGDEHQGTAEEKQREAATLLWKARVKDRLYHRRPKIWLYLYSSCCLAPASVWERSMVLAGNWRALSSLMCGPHLSRRIALLSMDSGVCAV